MLNRFLLWAWILFSGAVFAQPLKEPIKLSLKIEATPQSNPDGTGRPSPIKIFIYELKDPSAFNEAEQFSLLNDDRAVLNTNILRRDEMILKPEESRVLHRETNPETSAIGIVAAYQDPKATWRVTHTMPKAPKAAWYRLAIPAKKVNLLIQLQHQGVVMVPTP